MIKLSEYLTEAKEGKNVHLEHIEDLVFNEGVSGTRNFFPEVVGSPHTHQKLRLGLLFQKQKPRKQENTMCRFGEEKIKSTDFCPV